MNDVNSDIPAYNGNTLSQQDIDKARDDGMTVALIPPHADMGIAFDNNKEDAEFMRDVIFADLNAEGPGIQIIDIDNLVANA